MEAKVVVRRCDWDASPMQNIIQALSEHIEQQKEELFILPKKKCLQSITNTLMAAQIPYHMQLAGRMRG
jgi:hypothetical protein